MRIRLAFPKLSTRRLLALVALSAGLLSACHRSGPRPGLYATLGGWCAGACQDREDGRLVLPGGDAGGWTYQLGAWRARTGVLVLGGEWKDGRATVRWGGGYEILW